jgi:hypothetical protein
MHDKLDEIYQQMLKESNESMTVGTVKAGDLEGAKHAKPVQQIKTQDNQVDSPDEGASQSEVKKGGASTNMETVKKEKEIKDSVDFTSRFESLYKSVIGEELDMDDEISPSSEVEGENFDEEIGDFDIDSEDDMSEETDIATELRTMAERILELADKFSETSMDDDSLEDLDSLDDDSMGEDSEEDSLARIGESIKSEPEPKVLKKTDKGPHMSKTVKGKLATVSKKHAKNTMKGTHTGTPEKLSDKAGHANKSGMTVKGSGSAVSGKNADLLCK